MKDQNPTNAENCLIDKGVTWKFSIKEGKIFRKYIFKDYLLAQIYTTKIESTKALQRNIITNFINYHGIINQHKPDKLSLALIPVLYINTVQLK